MKSRKKTKAKRSSTTARTAPVVVEETTHLIAQPKTVLRRETVTLSRAMKPQSWDGQVVPGANGA
jgi:hypothetical protein